MTNTKGPALPDRAAAPTGGAEVRSFVVVGASAGLGQATARALLRAGHRVIAAGRDVERTRAAVPGAEIARVDLADLRDVVRFADELAAGPALAGVIFNAGVQGTGAPRLTRDGLDDTFAVNHLAHFAIATRLGAHGGRLIFVGSSTQDPGDRGGKMFGFRGGRFTDVAALAAGDGDPAVDDAQRARDRYATSKLCNLLTMRALASRGLDAYALDPGLMPGTGLARDRSWPVRLIWHSVMRVLAWFAPGVSSATRSGKAIAWLATDYTGAARYLDYRRQPVALTADAQRDDFADALYTGSAALIAAKTAAHAA